MMKRDFISIFDLTKEEIFEIFELTKKLKESQKKGVEHKILKDKTLAMIFEKPSLRTRVTFETGMTQLGGHAVYLAPADIQIGKRESVSDAAQNLSRWVDLIMARVFLHKTVQNLSKSASIPVINGLCNIEHPCQVMADIFTIMEKRENLDDVTISYIGDGNNVCNSLIAASALLGFDLRISTPKGYEPKKEYLDKAPRVKFDFDPKKVVSEANIIYTDVWASMGQESEKEQRKKVFQPYQINKTLLKSAKGDYSIMHCLPAHRGEEITDEVIDGPKSIALDQAENRLHIQKGIMVWLVQKSLE
jgi:ornithine carbamoyltransferase